MPGYYPPAAVLEALANGDQSVTVDLRGLAVDALTTRRVLAAERAACRERTKRGQLHRAQLVDQLTAARARVAELEAFVRDLAENDLLRSLQVVAAHADLCAARTGNTATTRTVIQWCEAEADKIKARNAADEAIGRALWDDLGRSPAGFAVIGVEADTFVEIGARARELVDQHPHPKGD